MILILIFICFSWLTIFVIRQLWWLLQVIPPSITKLQVVQKILNVIIVSTLPLWPFAAMGGFTFLAPYMKMYFPDTGIITRALFLSIYIYPISVFTGFVFFRVGWEETNSFKMLLSTLVTIVGPISVGFFWFYIP